MSEGLPLQPWPLVTDAVLPQGFPSPFNNSPHELAIAAAESLKVRLPDLCSDIHDFEVPGGGKMFGVLVVQKSDHSLAYYSAFSGMLGKSWHRDNFVPPVFSVRERDRYLTDGEARLADMASEIQSIETSDDYNTVVATLSALSADASSALEQCIESNKRRQQLRDKSRYDAPHSTVAVEQLAAESREDKRRYRELKRQWKDRLALYERSLDHYHTRLKVLADTRAQLSKGLQDRIFDGYSINSFCGESTLLKALFKDKLPPGGAGDCAAVKLLDYCIAHQFKPLCMAEFWWGDAPAGGVRHHGQYYPACRGKCRPILPYMLQGLDTQEPVHEVLKEFPATEPAIVFEDDDIVVVNKPFGMLSVPGKVCTDSVEARLRLRYPVADNATLLVHRLDQPTSGLMIAAKNARAHKNIQKQFINRQVHKRYCAVLNGIVSEESGTIELPLRVDHDDRPRQLVCRQFGKPSVTRYRVLARSKTTTRIAFEPVTGRSHQLRVHAAHRDGLNRAIVGDELYGDCKLGNSESGNSESSANPRLHLHAEYLSFVHPVHGQRIDFTESAPF